MTIKKMKKVWLLLILPIIFINMIPSNNKKIQQNAFVSASDSCDCYSTSSLYNIQVYFNNNVPGDLKAFNNQSQADCFAWQEFISLNWPVNASSSFGTPYDLAPVQWETYMPREVLFQDQGVKPPVWGTLVSDKYAKKFKTQRLLMNKMSTKLLTFTSKIDNSDSLNTFSADQAAPQGKPSWLGSQNGKNVWYEILLNKDYYDFVVQKGYYNATIQHDSVKAGHPINFPQGVYHSKVGAIELKAAWMEVPNPQSPQWARYKLSRATVLDPSTNQLRTTTVALVGLHILHKTTNQPTWVWATFEQVDNAPTSTTVGSPPYGYNFYNANCTAKQVTIKTATGDSVVTVSCTPNQSPPYYLSQAAPVPIQITRSNPIDPNDAAPINQRMQSNIKKVYPNSVWQYYELVDVIWSQSVQKDPTTPIDAPRKLNASSMQSGVPTVANTTLESYVQKTNTCTSCHVYSTIAPYPLDSINNDIFGDFSFAISFAKYKTTFTKPSSSNLKTPHPDLKSLKKTMKKVAIQY
ncbi:MULTISPECIES: hypothetical protein [unclassified Arcicella]|uniref:hypothetical protein n=1 Tax=unclassified Arcicella TaxID=2644986 RepID=UPI00285DAD76|nr:MULTISPECIES: hypothetical protein [unclassified Arcicella]MDR6564650.1 hypothetical protein [Arcicella sp. BE51]MDR6814422.1 hypothetical protein [Arcicella sp. BE140]MDR6825822.1 hypothetical protein [Arcicella sp. BE139]